MIEQRSVAIRSLGELRKEIREIDHVIPIHLGVIRLVGWIVVMMRRSMPRTIESAVGQRVRRGVATRHDRSHAGDVRLPSKVDQVVLQLDVIVVGFRNSEWYVGRQIRLSILAGKLKSA